MAQVTSTGNGRSGLTVAGSSNAVFRDCVVRENAEFSVLIDEFGQADLRDCQLDADATVKPRTP